MKTGRRPGLVLLYRILFTLGTLGTVATVVMGAVAIWSSGELGHRWTSTAALCFFTSVAVLGVGWVAWMMMENDRW